MYSMLKRVNSALKSPERPIVYTAVPRFLQTHLVRLHWPVLHVQVPDLDGQIISGHHVATAVAELHVRDGRDDF